MAAVKKRIAKRPPVKKAPAKKAVAKKTAPASKRVAKKSAPAKKSVAKKTAAKKSGGGFHRELNEHGFVPGTDSAHIADLLIAGGKDRAEVNAKVAKKIGTETRNGTEKNVPALVSGVLKTLEGKGYKVESSFALVPPARKRKK